VVLLVAVAALERFGRWCGRNWLSWRRGRPPASATGFDELTACFYAGNGSNWNSAAPNSSYE
jgi:hypothetical protein